ncbi:nuclear transport factor 2 family protein [Streptomyces sp. NPDC015171]|uniref:nuclear transport factor 2 family protein n=1 Tax=Streptomyces sp. NPDC015171 TaxID=3364945 RepID=UPI00370286BC
MRRISEADIVNHEEMLALWERHTAYEFDIRDADLTVSTMTDDASVMHLPTMSGGLGKESLREYYRDVFIPGIPRNTATETVHRSVGGDFLVEELIMRMPHDQEIPFLLPGLAPTGRNLEVPLLVIVEFRDQLMRSERLYWDQAAVLAQLGLITAADLPMADHTEVARFLRDKVMAAPD